MGRVFLGYGPDGRRVAVSRTVSGAYTAAMIDDDQPLAVAQYNDRVRSARGG